MCTPTVCSAHIKLFYNDYNDTNPKKADGICKLIEQIKANPEARIDGMGMQGHYDMDFPMSCLSRLPKSMRRLWTRYRSRSLT